MPLIFSAIVPHPPLIIPAIGKENANKLKATACALSKLANLLEKKQIDTVLTISPHGKSRSSVFTMNINPEVKLDYSIFGDFGTKKSWRTDIGLAHKIRENLETSAPLQLSNDDMLDHGASIPFFMLTQKIIGVKVLPLNPSGLSLKEHFEFGKQLGHQLHLFNKNIAVIASGDLSHRLTKEAPAGYSPKGKKFDKKIIELLLLKEYDKIIDLDPTLIEEAGQCGLNSIMIQQGLLNEMNYKPKLLSYESPFGVGYLVMNFEL